MGLLCHLRLIEGVELNDLGGVCSVFWFHEEETGIDNSQQEDEKQNELKLEQMSLEMSSQRSLPSILSFILFS